MLPTWTQIKHVSCEGSLEVNADVVKDPDMAHILVPKAHPCPKLPAVIVKFVERACSWS